MHKYITRRYFVNEVCFTVRFFSPFYESLCDRCIQLPTYQDVVLPACTSDANFAYALRFRAKVMHDCCA